MANNLTALSPSLWSRLIAKDLRKKTIFRSVASFAEQGTLSYGVDVDRPYRSALVAENYTKGSALSAQDLTAISDKLTINKQKGILAYCDSVDKIQNSYDAALVWSKEMALQLAIIQDAEFLYEVRDAANSVDDGDLGGTPGNSVNLQTSNIDAVFGRAARELDVANVGLGDRFAAISPQTFDVLWNRIAGKESILGDKTSESGMVGRYRGFDLYLSNNLTASVRITPNVNPINAETLVINGVTFTFVNSIGSAPGNVLQTTDTASTIDNLVALINAGDVGDGVLSVSLSDANKKVLQGWVAVDGTTYLDVYAKGASYMTCSDTANITYSRYAQHNMFGKKGAVDMVIQKEPSVEMSDMLSAGKFGKNIGALTVFGVKTFHKGLSELVDVLIDSSVF